MTIATSRTRTLSVGWRLSLMLTKKGGSDGAVYLRPLDNIESEKKAETNGVMANIGGGADWELMDKLSVGPRLHVGFGSFTVVQASGVASFKF